MSINYELSKVVIRRFRGIADLELELRHGVPTVLLGSNNAGKTTILNAIALAFHNGEFYNWAPEATDFYSDPQGIKSKDLIVQVHFKADSDLGYPAVRTIGEPQFVCGVQVVGKTDKKGALSHVRTLLGKDGKPITLNTRTKQSDTDKVALADHGVGWQTVNAKLDQIRDHLPDTWYFKPEDIEASLYVWKNGPLSKLSRHLADRFMVDKWTMKIGEDERPMPDTLERGYQFFQETVAAFPFWTDEMKPDLERIFSRYIGGAARFDLTTSTQSIKDWLAQQLMIAMATDSQNAATPLRSMGDGWQSVIRLAALEALTLYPDLTRDRTVLLLEEPETHLHPHLRRKLRKVLGELAEKGWVVVYTTHSSEMVSFEEKMAITRLVRTKGRVVGKTLYTDEVEAPAKLQSKLDDNGSHDFLFSTAAVFCEGAPDKIALKHGMEKLDVDVDGLAVSITSCGGCTGIPSFAFISEALGIRWCALTDEDVLADGTTKPQTSKARERIEKHRSHADLQLVWSQDLEGCLGVATGKADMDTVRRKLDEPEWQTEYPRFHVVLAAIATWIEQRQ